MSQPTAPRIVRALALVDELQTILTTAGLTKVTVTIDENKVLSGARHGVVIVLPPDLTFEPPYGDVQAAYELLIVAGPHDNYLVAWDRIDNIIQAFVQADVNLAEAKPATYEPLNGDPLNAYTVTLNDLN